MAKTKKATKPVSKRKPLVLLTDKERMSYREKEDARQAEQFAKFAAPFQKWAEEQEKARIAASQAHADLLAAAIEGVGARVERALDKMQPSDAEAIRKDERDRLRPRVMEAIKSHGFMGHEPFVALVARALE